MAREGSGKGVPREAREARPGGVSPEKARGMKQKRERPVLRPMRLTLPALLVCLAAAPLLAAPAGVDNATRPALPGKPHVFTFGGPKGEQFLLDGKPFQIRAGEYEPQRIPKEYWRHRLRQAKAMGLNTIAFYVFWNDVEQPDGTFDFKSGSRDIAGFLRLCQEEGLWVLFRPGPYVCGEWDFGGIPSRLLKYPDLKIRTVADKRFMDAQTRYLQAVAAVARPYLASRGGPILMTQIENEFGSWSRPDRAYLLWLKDFWTKQGFAPFYTSDGSGHTMLKNGTLPGVAVGLDPGENDGAFNAVRKANPGVPMFSSETYPGWLRHWGEGNWQPTDKRGALNWFMKHGHSFNLFVLHGGTNFGFTAGANEFPDQNYQPDLTSYDYGAPIDEQGRTTKAYHELRDIILGALPEAERASLPPVPDNIPAMELADFTPERIAGLWDNLPAPKHAPTPPYFEAWGQNQGMAVYRVKVPAGPAAKLTFENLHDFGQVHLDGKLLATVDRRKGKKPAPVDLPERAAPATLEVLVEAMGHVNFHQIMEQDRKGLFGAVKLGATELKNWQVIPLPLHAKDVVAAPRVESPSPRPGSHFRGKFTVPGTPADTFLDMSKYAKGTVWVNGHNLGRYWSVGPQLRLYCPASWLKPGDNVIDILDLEMTEPRPIRGCVERNFDMRNAATRNANNEW